MTTGWRPVTERLEKDIEEERRKLELMSMPDWGGVWERVGALFSPLTWWGKYAASRLAYPWTRRAQQTMPHWEEPEETGWLPRRDIPAEAYEQWQAPWGVKGAMELGTELPFWMALPGGVGLKAWRGLAPRAEAGLAEKVGLGALRAEVAPLAAVEKAGELGMGAIGKVGKAIIPRVGELSERTLTRPLASDIQKLQINRLAQDKLLLSKTGKFSSSFRNLLFAMTGREPTKTTTKRILAELNDDEANLLIDAINRLVVKKGIPPKIPKTAGVMTEEFMHKVPLFKEISILDRVRQVPYALNKIGLRREVWEPFTEEEFARMQEAMVFRKQLQSYDKLIGGSVARKNRIFEALENPLETHRLDPPEQEVYKFFRGHFDEWADRLGLAPTKRRKNYITNIFDETHQRIYKEHNAIDPELLVAMDYVAPKQVFMPFLLERTGMRAGLIKDPFVASDIYNRYALRKIHYEPIITRIRAYMPYLPPSARSYLKSFADRLAGRPQPLDREMNQAITEFVGATKRFMPKPIANWMTNWSQRGNPAGYIAYNYASLLYQAWLGLRPVSAIRNLSQNILTVAEVGPLGFARGIKTQLTGTAKKALEKSFIELSRKYGYLPGVEHATIGKVTRGIQKSTLAMFRGADKVNVRLAFTSGYAEAKRLGLPEKWAIKRGDEVAMQTQYLYLRIASSWLEETALGRFLTPLTSWPRNWVELMMKWVSGRQSQVYQDFMKETGQKLAIPEKSRKQLLTYLALVTAAGAVQASTGVRALEYTGWRSIGTLANIIKGEVPGLEMIGGIAQLVGSATQGDTTGMKQAWAKIRPDRFISIIRQLESIARGDSDWLSIFIYLNKEKRGKTETYKPTEPYKPK